MSDQPRRYRAFISYSQKDKAFARRLHRALETYRLPRGAEVEGVDKKTNKLGRLFRDDDEMGAATDLGAALQGAIADAENLIVVCSPNAAQSRWVNEEILHFKRIGRADRIFAVIVGGEPTPVAEDRECFPPALRFELGPDGALTDSAAEPLGLDVRKEPFNRLITRLAAGLIRTPFDALWKREQRRAQARVLAVSLTVILTAATIAGTATQNSWRPRLDAYLRYTRFAHSSAQLGGDRPGATFQDCRSGSGDCPVMVVIPPGHILIGSFEQPEQTQQTIAVSLFAVSENEITFANWQACIDAGGCNYYAPDNNGWDGDRRPVINVSWSDAQGYVEWLSNATGVRYRLLTDAEWEYAARSSIVQDAPRTMYSWGDEPPVCDVTAPNGAPVGGQCVEGAEGESSLSAFVASLFSDAPHDLEHRPFTVGSFRPNSFGLHDMHGNVWEWVDGCVRVDANDACRARVMRGGGRGRTPSEDATSSSRQLVRDGDHYRTTNVGFRVARGL